MRLLALILLTVSVFSLEAQNDTLQYQTFYYGKNLKSSEGYFYLGKPHGLWKNYYPNENLKSIGEWKKGVLSGKWIFFDENSDTTEVIHYRFGIKNGWNYKYKNNKIYLKQLYLDSKIIGLSYLYKDSLVEEIPYKNGLKHGLAFLYQDDLIIELIDYKNGYKFSHRKINRYNKNHLKQGAWIDFHPNRAIHIEKNYKNDTLNGFYREYSPTGTLLKNLYYVDGVLDTASKNLSESKIKQTFYENGNLKTTGFFKQGVKVGLHQELSQDAKLINAKLYDENGVFLGEGRLDKKGRKIGLWKYYYEDKSLKSEGNYKKGRRIKVWSFYYPNGKLEQKGNYRSGKYNGLWTHYDENGNILKKENYHKGRLEGDYEQYNLKKELVVKGTYKDGKKDGHWQFIYDNITIDEYYESGLKEGQFKSTYSNGTLAFQGAYQQDYPNGKHLYYYKNGNLKLYQYYVYGSKEKIWTWYDAYGVEKYSYTYKNNKVFKINGIRYKMEDYED